jgi:hypothetical protein
MPGSPIPGPDKRENYIRRTAGVWQIGASTTIAELEASTRHPDPCEAEMRDALAGGRWRR